MEVGAGMSAIGMSGTFDLENYGDLLFPLIAAHELGQRRRATTLRCFSYFERRAAAWPFEVTPLARFADEVATLRGLIIGGGHIVRFDKAVAPGYFPAPATVHHPLGLWLTPALLALQHGVPVAWNAPALLGAVPDWAAPMLTAALEASDYVAVRDAASQRELQTLVPHREIALVPDSVFGIGALIDAAHPSAACLALRERAGLGERYVVVQSVSGIEPLLRALLTDTDCQVLALPMGPVLGDADAYVEACVPHAICLDEWPHPLLIAELIAGAQAVIGPSLHLAISALACGVPVFRGPAHDDGKYALLRDFEGAGLHRVDARGDVSPGWFRARCGRGPVSPQARAARDALAGHWDRIAHAFGPDRARAMPASLSAMWQRLPGDFERAAKQLAKLDDAQRTIAALRAENAALRHSLSWRVTAPLRSALAALRGTARGTSSPAGAAIEPAAAPAGHVLRFESIERAALASEPYAWARIDHLYSPANAAQLEATFPRDSFKIVRGYDGEKEYCYHARALIGMGSTTISAAPRLSAAWRQLAADLLSPRYRAALSALTGIELSALRMEANAFHYGPGAWLGPHVDLADKIVTHVLYFNAAWDPADGGCLRVLRSAQMSDVACEIAPSAGSSAVLVRSDRSWHAVSRVDRLCAQSRRSVTVTFYRAAALSTMWPPGENAATSEYVEGDG